MPKEERARRIDLISAGTVVNSSAAVGSAPGLSAHDAVTLGASVQALLSISGQVVSLDSQAANLHLMGPTSGADAVPTFRALVDADLGTALGPTFDHLHIASTTVVTNLNADMVDGLHATATPTLSTDLVTKGYVDLAVAALNLDEYFSNTASDIGGIYYVMTDAPASAGTVVSATISSSTTTNVFNFATLASHPHLDRLLAGVYDIHAHLLKTGNRTITVYCELYKRILAGTETLLGTSASTTALTASDVFYDLYLTLDTEVTLLTTDRLVLKYYAVSTGAAGNTTVTMTVGGTADPHLSISINAVELHQVYLTYTGAHDNVDLGAYSLSAGGLTVSAGVSQTVTIGNQTASSTTSILDFKGKSSGGTALSTTMELATDGYFNISTQGLNHAIQLNTVTGALGVANNLTVGSTVLQVNVSGTRVGVNCAADSQFALDVAGSTRTTGYFVGKHAIQLPGAIMVAHYDGGTPYTTDFTGDPTGHMGQAATITGGVIYRPGKFGKAVQCAEATTNLCLNPSFEVNATGWFTAEASATLTRVTTESVYGACAGLYTRTASVAWSIYAVYTVSGATTGRMFAWTFYAKAAAAADVGRVIAATIFETGGATGVEGSSVDFTLTATWQRCTVLRTLLRNDRTGVQVRCVLGSVGAALIDACQLEEKAYATAYCDGSLGTGHSWSGTAHASTSARTAGSLTYVGPVPLNTPIYAGSISFWGNQVHPTGVSSYHLLVGSATTTAGLSYIRMAWHWSGTTNVLITDIVVGNGATTDTYTIGTETSASRFDVWNHYCLTWDNGTACYYVNGTQVGTASYTNATYPGALYFASGITLHANGSKLNDDLVVLDRAMSAVEVRAIYESNAPVFAESSTFTWRNVGSNSYLDETGLWMADTSGNECFGFALQSRAWSKYTLGAGDVFIGDNVTGKACMWWDYSAGKLLFRGNASDTDQVYIDTDGTLKAGAGKCILDSNGLGLSTTAAWDRTAAISFLEGASVRGSIYNLYSGSSSQMWQYVTGLYGARYYLQNYVSGISAGHSLALSWKLQCWIDGTHDAYLDMQLTENGAGVSTAKAELRNCGLQIMSGGSSVAVAAGCLAVDGSVTIANSQKLYFRNSTGSASAAMQQYSDNNIYWDNPAGAFIFRQGAGTTQIWSLSANTITIADSTNFVLNTGTGTKIGTGTTQKLGFWNATPVVQQAHIADLNAAWDASDLDTDAKRATRINDTNGKVNTILARLETLGLSAAT